MKKLKKRHFYVTFLIGQRGYLTIDGFTFVSEKGDYLNAQYIVEHVRQHREIDKGASVSIASVVEMSESDLETFLKKH